MNEKKGELQTNVVNSVTTSVDNWVYDNPTNDELIRSTFDCFVFLSTHITAFEYLFVDSHSVAVDATLNIDIVIYIRMF